MIPKSQDDNIFARKKSRPFLVQYLSSHEIVSATVELNSETCFGAIKINCVAIDRMLPSKFPALKLPIAKVTP